jgi:thiopeptide-type bacteriocin biosynthesis protein
MPRETAPQWQQVNIEFASDPVTTERNAFAALGPALTDAENDGLITAWWFIRKPWWKIRYLPASGTGTRAAERIHDTAKALHAAGHARQWVPGIYEPETAAFGGPDAMATAHRLFHADSRHIIRHLPPGPHSSASNRRELSLLLCTALMRHAGQDRFERGDTWSKVTELRPGMATADRPEWATLRDAAAAIISVDSGPHTALRTRELHHADHWLTSFEAAGNELRALAEQGLLTRGIRAVLAHHVIFHWNRLGLPVRTQANLASAAASACIPED